MLKKCLPVSFTILAFMITLLFACFDTANAVPDSSESAPVAVPDDSVLRLIPKGALGVIYCSSLLELDSKINALVAELAPTLEIPDVSVTSLVEIFGVEFESLADFEEIGLDLNRDFAVFITSLQPLHLLVLGHLTDPKVMKQTIEAKGSVSTNYKGVTYWNTTAGNQSFAILEDTLVFSTPYGVCESVIDTHNGEAQTIGQNSSYGHFLADILAGDDQGGVCIDIEGIIATFDRPLEEELESLVDTLKASDSVSKEIASFLDQIPEEEVNFLEQIRSIGTRLEVEGTDLQIKPSVTLKNDSEFLKMLEEVSGELAFLDELPNRASVNGAFQGCPQLEVELSEILLAAFPQETPEQQARRDLLFEQIKTFHASLVDRWSVSFNFRGSLLPDSLFIYELKDEQRAKIYMDEIFLEQLHEGGIYAGQSMMHNRVEIKSYIFPNLTERLPEEFPEEIAGLMPTELHWYYGFTEGQLLFATGTGPEAIQMALDRKVGNEEKFSDFPSYQELVDQLGTDNNIFVAISPAITTKNSLPMLGEMDPNNAALQLLSGIFMNLPEDYSISFSARRQENSIGAKLLLKLGDFKQLIQMVQMMAQMGRMQ